MADVFISYSRLDKDFVGKLREALIAQAQEVWIDWESIPPSQAWWSEIQKGIARANNFVVVLSPASMASPICQMEIEYARQLKKRIIPVLHADYDREACLVNITKRLAKKEETSTREIWGSRQPHDVFDANDAELKHINYFFFKSDADFPTRFTDLFSIIRTDYAHKERHTTLELRALEWDRRRRDASFLLIENELKEAQDWLAAAPGKEPAPTDLHRVYIDASAKRTRQLRTIRRASVIGSAVAVIAILFAVGASVIGARAVGEANAQLGTATVQQGIAEGRAEAVETQVAAANAQLTAVPPTLEHVATQVQAGESRIESLRLAAEGITILNAANGNVETAALLGIRALRADRTAQAGTMLMRALDSVFTQHLINRYIFSVALSPDGETALLANIGDAISVWDLPTGIEVDQLQIGPVSCMAFSPDGRWIVTGANSGVLKVWSAETGVLIREFPVHSGGLLSVAFSPDGRFVLSGGTEDANVHLWNMETGAIVREFKGHQYAVSTVAFSPDGSLIASVGYDNTIRLWDVEAGTELHQFAGGSSAGGKSVAFSPDGQTLLAPDRVGRAVLWNVETGREVGQLNGHQEAVMSVAFSPDGHYALTGSLDGTARLWDVEIFAELRRFSGHTGQVIEAAFTSDGRFAVTRGYDSVRVWDVFNPSDTRVFDRGDSWVTDVAYNLDGDQLVTLNSGLEVRVWDVTTQRVLKEFDVPETFASDFSADGVTLLAGYPGGEAMLWDTATGNLRGQLVGHTADINCVRLSADGRLAITVDINNMARIWDVETQTELNQFKVGLFNAIASAAFSPDGQTVVTGDTDSLIQLWDTTTGTELRKFNSDVDFGDIVYDLAFSPDGESIVAAGRDRISRLWNVNTENELQQFSGHTGDVVSVAFSPDGKTILTGSYDGTARLWSIEDGSLLFEFIGTTSAIYDVTFSPDGKHILTGANDGTIRIWSTDYQEIIADACTRVFRDFTDEERARYRIDDTPTCEHFGPLPAAGA